MAYRVPRCSRRFAARLFAVWRRALAALPRWARAQGLRGVVLAAACAPGGGWLWGGAAGAAEYAKVYVIANPSTAQNGGAGGAQALVTGGLLRVNANLTVNADYAIRINDVNGATVAVAPNVTVSGTRALQLHNVNVHPNCSINIAGAMTASTVYTLMDSKKNDTNCDHAVFNFLNGAIVSGPQNAASGIQTRNAAFMTFGYASGENGDTLGDAIGVAYGTGSDTGALTKVDNSAVINIGVPITKVDSGIWTAYVAAGTTNFYDERTSTSTDPQKEIGAMYVGAAGFTEADLIPKTDNAYTATKIVPVVGAKATVNFGKEGDTGTNHYHITIRNLTINSGGTVNVTNHARLGVSTALDLNGGTLNIASGCTIPINNATITAASGTSTINGVIPSATASAITVTPKNFMVAEGATLNLNNVVINKSIGDGTFRVNGTLVFNGKSGVTMTAGERVTYVAGTLINNCSDDLDLKGVNANSTNWIFVSGGRPTIGVGTGWVNFSTSLRNNSCPAIDLLVLGKVKSGFTDSTKTNTAGFYIADDKTYSLHGVHVHTCGGTFTVDGTLEFAGDTKDDGVLTIDNKAGGDNRNCYVTTVTVAADKYGTLNGNVIGFNDAKNLQTVTINDGGTLRYGMTNVTAPKITTLNLHGTLTNQRAAGAAALAVTNLSVAAGKSGALSGTGKTTVATPVVAGNLAIDGADVAFTGAVAGGGGVAVKNSGALATVGGALGAMTLDGGTLTNSTAALGVASMAAKGSSLVSGAGAVNADALSVASGTLTFDNPGAITAADVSSGGALVLKNGALAAATVAGTLDYQKTGATDLTLAGGTAKVAAGQTLTAATVSGFGTLSGPGETAVATLTATGGTLTKSAPGAVASAVADGGTLALQGGTVGTAAVRGGGALNYKLATNALALTELDGALNNARGAELTVSGLGAVDGAASVTGGPVRFADAIAVTGTLNLDAKTRFASGLTVNGGTLGVNFDAAAAPAATVTGAADFSGGGKVKVAARGGAGGSAYRVITAGAFVGLDLANASVTGDTAILRYSLRLDPGALMLLCERNSYTENAATPSDYDMAAVLDEIVAAPGLAARMRDVFAALDALGSPGAVSRALGELNYGAAAGVSTATARMAWRNFDDLLSTRISREGVLLAARRTLLPRLAPEGVPGPETDAAARAAAGGKPGAGAPGAAGLEARWRPAREWRGFLQIDGGFGAEGSAPGGAVGYDYRGLGLLAGLERRYGEELALGALLGWTTNHGDLSQSRGEAHDNVLRLGGYGAWRWGGFFGTLAPTVGCHLLETRRHVGFMGRTARGGRTGLDVHLLGQAGYVWELPHDFLVTPEASLAMTYMHDPEYTEAGAGGACLKIDALDDWSLTQNLKLTVGKAVRLGGGFALLPEVWGGWEHEYGATNDVSCAFAAVPGMKWRVPVADIASDRAVVGAGVHALFNDRVDLYGRYELKAWKGGSFHQFSLGAGIKF